MMSSKSTPKIGKGQVLHFTCLAILLTLVGIAWTNLGRPVPPVFWIAVAFPIVHQIFVWLAWRLELRSSVTSRTIGLNGYVFVFFVLFIGRFVSLGMLGWYDADSLNLAPIPRITLTVLLLVPGLYAGYSVQRYFGMVRASGADHFDPQYRDLPLVKQGIFRFTNNGMYLHAFLLFWTVAIGFNSDAALVVAAFSHAYIWVHFYAVEKPDMDFLYGS
jgi:hypothetical protein